MNYNLTSPSRRRRTSTPIEVLNMDSNAQFPSPDHSFPTTPPELCANLMISQETQLSSSTIATENDVGCQTLLTLPRNLPKEVENILTSYLLSEDSDVEMPSKEATCDSDDFQNILQLAQTYDYGVPSPPISEISSDGVEQSPIHEETSQSPMNITDNESE